MRIFCVEQVHYLSVSLSNGFKIEENKPYKCPACKKIFSGRKFKAYFAQPINIANLNKWYIILLCDKCGECNKKIEVGNTTLVSIHNKFVLLQRGEV